MYFCVTAFASIGLHLSDTITIFYQTRLANKLKEAQNIKEEINREINQKTEYLDSLQPKLNSILQVNSIMFIFFFM